MASFNYLYAKFRGLLQESWQTAEVAAHFGPTATLDSMFQYLWSRPETQQVLLPPAGNSRISMKGASEAEKFRNEGNRLYRERKLEQALKAYNYSILAAPHPRLADTLAANPVISGAPTTTTASAAARCLQEYEGLALAYANRSAVLYEMSQYEAALADAERALSFGYPPARRHRLQERRTKCLQALGRPQEAKGIIEETLSMLATISLDPKEMTIAQNSLTKLLGKCEGKSAAPVQAPFKQYKQLMYSGPLHPPAVSSPRQDLPGVSSALRIHYTPIRGRHLLADRDIQPGMFIG